MLSSKRVVLPLVGSFFLPGKAKETIEEIEEHIALPSAFMPFFKQIKEIIYGKSRN